MFDLDDLYGDLATNDPATFYARLRERDPVYFNPRWGGWILTRYQDVAAAYRDHARLSSNRMAGPWGEKSARRKGGGEVSPVFHYLGQFFAWMDQPDHTRFRNLLQTTFTPQSVEGIRPRVTELVHELTAGLPRDEPFDFIESYAFHLPVIVISEYLGTPPEERLLVKKWSDDLSHTIFAGQDGMSAQERARLGEEAVRGFADYFGDIIRARRSAPRDDLISRMVQAGKGADALSDDEVIAQCILMIFAGHETTANLLANGMVAFDRHPSQWRALRERPELARPAVEEMLRYDGPIGGQGRWARTSFEFGGKSIAESDRVMLVQWAANRDPEMFADPDVFDITRQKIRHLGFGHGIHTCLGSPLARIEVQETLRHFATEFAALDVVTDPLRYKPTLTSRALVTLEVVSRPA
ncbi:cytochrome P450 [Streptosporangium sp. NPDC006013]|uniref:cytochrome P450 n=1 Tax=Streptosporangium sp. NPDC006013 TaxID=3155596 RepID=UPI0033A703B0